MSIRAILVRYGASAYLLGMLVAAMLIPATTSAQNTFTHRVPLRLPRGANAMQPDLALVYSSGGGQWYARHGLAAHRAAGDFARRL
jgi:hypothetical protein